MKGESFPPGDVKGKLSLSVIVATHQRPVKLSASMVGLMKQNHEIDELIIVHTPHTETESIIEYFKDVSTVDIRSYIQEPKGLANARNLGVQNANGDIIAFTDDDCIPPENWTESILWVFENHDDVVTVGGMQQPHANGFVANIDAERVKRNQDEGKFKIGGRELKTFGGANVAFRKDPIIEYDILRQGQKGRENDRPYQLEILKKTGDKNAYIPVTVDHIRDYTLSGMVSQRFKNGLSAVESPGGRTVQGSIIGLIVSPVLLLNEILKCGISLGIGMWLNDMIVRCGMVFGSMKRWRQQ